jgi:vancomycin aglycone glucosyltransferase
MRVLLSTIGSRGDVQPLVALGLELRALGQEVRLCVPPDFRDWIEGLGLAVTPIGPELRKLTASSPPATPAPLSPELRRQMVDATVATQFETIAAAAQGCDLIVGATALQIAAPSVAEKMGIPYVFAAYCPTVLPSPHHAPIPLGMLGETPAPATADNRELWARDAERVNGTFGAALNTHRASIGLAPVGDVRGHIFTGRPWLAADPVLAPWPDPADPAVVQTGAWILPDERPLSPELEAFLEAGEPPVYFGFGSIRAPRDLSQVMIQSARALGRRAIVSRGWADLSLVDGEPDCLAIGEVNQRALFGRVAAAVHHGGAGTTTAAALAGAPQVVIPQMYDQPYWAQGIHQLGLGTAHAPGTPTTGSLTSALERTLHPDVAARARSIATEVRGDGAQVAAQRLMTTVASIMIS